MLLRSAEEGFEAIVHVLLYVAVEERKTGLFCGEVDDGATVVGDDHRVLDEASHLLAIHLDQFPLVAV